MGNLKTVGMVIAVAFVVTMVALAVACAPAPPEEVTAEEVTPEEAAPPEEAPPKEEVLLTAPGVQPYKGVSLRILTSEAVPELAYEHAINDAKYVEASGVNLVYENVPWTDLVPKITTMCSAQTADYDVFFNEDQWQSMFAGCTEELDRFYKVAPGDIHLEDFPVRTIGIAMNKKSWTGVPGVVPVGILAYRTDLFADPNYQAEFKEKYGRELKVPETWEEYLQVGQFFVRDTDGDGKVDLWGFNHRYGEANSMFADWAIGFAFSRGFDLFDENFNPTINTPQAIDAAKFFLSKEFLAAQPPGAESYFFAEVLQNMAQGKVAMFITETWAIPLLLDPKQSPYADKIAFAPIPAWKNPETGELQRRAFFVGHSFSINHYSPEKVKWAAWDYLQFIRGKTLARPYTEQTGASIRLSTLTDPELVAKWAHLAVIAEAMKYPSSTRPSEPFSPEVMFAVGKEMSAALTGEKTVEQALNDANETLKKIVEDAGYYEIPHRSYSAEERIAFACEKLKELGVEHPECKE